MNKLPTICFDRDIFQLQVHGGIRLYFSELIRALSLFSSSELALPHQFYPRTVYPKCSASMRLSKFLDLLPLFSSFFTPLLPIFRLGPALVYHPTYYRNPFIRFSCNPVVITIHDLIHERCPYFFDSTYHASIKRYVKARHRNILAADAIIVVSHATRDDLLATYPFIAESKIHVVYHGADHVPLVEGPCTVERPEADIPYSKYLLYVGSRSHYKGFNDLLSAISTMPSQYADIGLVCIGKPFSGKELLAISRLGLKGRILSLNSSDADMIRFYNHALAFVYPSWKEGFGLPILEAMRAFCPVICSDIPSSLEIARGYCLFYKACDCEALCLAIRHSVNLSQKQNLSFLKAAQAHASLFTWKNTARQTSLIYHDLISAGRYSSDFTR